MACTKRREDIVNDLVLKEGNTIVTDSLIVANMYKEEQNSVISTIINLIQSLNEIGKSDFSPDNFIKSIYTIKGIDYPKFKITESAFAYNITMGDINVNALKVKIGFLHELKHVTEKHQNRDKIQVKVLLRIQQLEKEVRPVEHRSNTLGNLNTESCLQQRLNKMIRLLAFSEDISFQKAWRVFRSMYNRTYRTNLKLKMYHYKKKNELKRITAPQYLAIKNQLENAIRVADRLLNKKNTTA
ncbi:Rha family transcriptional regulator [Bacillus paramycoides]|uniref:Rha family transcriptional regulator n=1 Tax=Bacillus paramycoides TaxID=2026194 RepID=UPI0015BA8750|nr:Rha family transcriptional regulator [Bacillus paramycoides]NWK71125.1 Rha family transcriptional regulator [Bacillus paramycoides]